LQDIGPTRHVTHQLYCQADYSCPPVSHLVLLFGHVARADLKQDHHRVIAASLRPPSYWRPCGRPRTSWLRAIDTNVQSVNIGIHSAWRKASDRTLWRRIVDAATLHHGARHWRKKRRGRPIPTLACPAVGLQIPNVNNFWFRESSKSPVFQVRHQLALDNELDTS